MDDIVNKELLTSLIKKYKGRELTLDELSSVVSMSSFEKTVMKILWEPAFNRSWIVLSKQMIKDWFCTEDTQYAVIDFYRKILTKNFIEGDDYLEISKDDPLVADVEDKYNLFSHSTLTLKKPGTTTKYYKVSNDCFKHLCMLKNRKLRLYFIKMERLTTIMRDYIFTTKLEKQTREICEMKERLANKIERMTDEAHDAKDKTGFIYIATTRLYASNNIYKIGRCKDVEKRMFGYQTGRSVDDLMYCVWSKECDDCYERENRIKVELQSWLETSDREIVKGLTQETLIQLIKKVL